VITLQRGEGVSLRLVFACATREQVRTARWHLCTMRDGYGAGCNMPPSLAGGGLDAAGTVTIRGLPSDMEFSQIGVQLVDAGVSPRTAALTREQVRERAVHELSFTAVARSAAPLRGRVVDSDGRPVPGLLLTCSANLAAKGARQTRTDAAGAGAFTFTSLVALGERFSPQAHDARWVLDQPKAERLDPLRYRRQFHASLILRRPGNGDDGAHAISDRAGRFRLTRGPGEHHLACYCGHDRNARQHGERVELRSGVTTALELVRTR
jgi:hypothetical protein